MIKSVRVISSLILAAAVFGGATLLLSGCGRKPAATQSASSGGRKILYYKSTMMAGETSKHPGKDSMGMEMVPVYAKGAASTPAAAPKTGGAAQSTPSGKGKILYYKSTMIPGQISQHPGKDSMGMDMVPVYANQSGTPSNPDEVAVDPVTMQDMNVATAPVLSGPLTRTVRTVGYVDYNEPALADVTTKFKGWIERLYVTYTGQLVRRGAPLFTIYSPELYSAEVEYLLADGSGTNTDSATRELGASALTKLRFFDISEAQIAELKKTRRPSKTLTIDAPITGFAITKNIVEGTMVGAGTVIYRLADLRTIWVYAEVYEQDLPYVQLGQAATMTLSYLPGRTFHGRLTYIYPTVNAVARTAKVRLEFKNPDYSLKPGMFANVTLTARVAPSVVLVPDSAVLRSGERNTVFVALPGGKFDPRTVKLGLAAANDYDQVLSGLKPGERVVTSGQFMLDSESQLQEAIQKMLAAPKTAGTNAPSTGTSPAAPPAAATNSSGGMNMPRTNMPEMKRPALSRNSAATDLTAPRPTRTNMPGGMNMPGVDMPGTNMSAPSEESH